MKRTIIIAEAGVNHNGKIDIAKRLILKAKNIGADYIKFQLYEPDEISTKKAEKALYQKKYSHKEETQYGLLKRLHLNNDEMFKLYKYAKKKRIGFLLSVFDVKSLEFLEKIKLDYLKIPSGEINNLPFLISVRKLQKNIILSTGMANLKEIKTAYKLLKNKKKKFIILHCNSAYPTPDIDANLGLITVLKKKFKTTIGYSDHTQGIEAAICAVTLGASVIEKHFTLNKKMKGPDHTSSLNPYEFERMVLSIRKIEKFFSKKKYFITRSEMKNIPIVRKSIVASKDISKEEKFSIKNLTTKRPGTGISPMKWFKVLNKKARRKFLKDQLISL